MISALAVLLASLLTLSCVEHGVKRWPLRINFATISFGTLWAVLLLALHELTEALLVALYLLLVVGTASRLKFAYLGTTLVAADIPLLTTNLPFLQRTYRRETILLCVAFAALTAAFAFAIALAPSVRVSAPATIGFAAIALTAFAVDYLKRLRRLGPTPNSWGNCDHFANFMRSLVSLKRSVTRFDFREVAASPLPLDVRQPARGPSPGTALPDIVLILHESTFDPALYGLPVDDDIREFLSPPDGVCGTLAVDVFGGGTVQTEFRVLTGLSSLAFGDAASLVWPLAPGRIHHSLPGYLASLGYRSTVIAADFANLCSRNFYSAMGFDRQFFVDDMLPVPVEARWRAAHPDELMYEAALHRWDEIAHNGPRFMMVNTLMNHGPHSRPIFAGPRAHAARASALAQSGNRAYAEYYSRLAVAAAAYRGFATALGEASGRPTLIVRFGDHQPKLGLRVPDGSSRYRTFYAIEPRRLTLDDRRANRPDPLDSAFLPTVALQAAGLPLDGFYTAQAALIARCGSAYDAVASERKAAFHRSLVDAQLVTATPVRIQRRSSWAFAGRR